MAASSKKQETKKTTKKGVRSAKKSKAQKETPEATETTNAPQAEQELDTSSADESTAQPEQPEGVADAEQESQEPPSIAGRTSFYHVVDLTNTDTVSLVGSPHFSKADALKFLESYIEEGMILTIVKSSVERYEIKIEVKKVLTSR